MTRKKRRPPNVIRIRIKCLTRKYAYEARVCGYTGRLMGVRAGCRRWRNFSEAFAHYRGEGKYPSGAERFTDKDILTRVRNATCFEYMRAGLSAYADRREGRAILRKLETRVHRRQRRIRGG